MPSSKNLEQSRYILLYYHLRHVLPEKDIKWNITSTISRIYGLHGNVVMGIYFSLIHPNQNLVLIRIANKYVYEFYTCLLFLREISFIPIKTFGSIDKAKKYIDSVNWIEFKENFN